MIGWWGIAIVVTARPEGEYTIKNAEIKPAGNGRYSLQLKEKMVGLGQLLNELKSKERESRLNALRAIAWPEDWPKNDSGALIKVLGDCLKDKEVSVRYHAVDALSRVGPECVAVLPALMVTAKDKEALIRGQALRAIGKIGPEAKPAIPGLIDSLDDEQHLIAGLASHALGNIGVDAVPALIKALRNPNVQVRTEATTALAMIGPKAKEAIPALKELFADSDKSVAYQARSAVNDIEEAPGRAIRIFPGKLDGKREKQK